MEKGEILNELERVFLDVLEKNDILLSESTTAADIEEWDSLTHIQLVVKIEKKFKIRFNSKEIQSWRNIGDMIDSIKERLGRS